jgi:hypothetical protein
MLFFDSVFCHIYTPCERLGETSAVSHFVAPSGFGYLSVAVRFYLTHESSRFDDILVSLARRTKHTLVTTAAPRRTGLILWHWSSVAYEISII